MKYLIVFISLVLFSETIHAQYKQVEVIMKDDRKRKGFAESSDYSNNKILRQKNRVESR